MVRIAVIGAGYLGRFHIEKLKKIENCSLKFVCEIDKKIARSIEEEFNVPVISDFKKIVGEVDAVSIVTPTPAHYKIADFFLSNNIHLFIEKPVTDNVLEAKRLLQKRKRGVIVQVGYIERFNPAFKLIKKYVDSPKSIIFKRKAPFNIRGSDVDVVFDLMIHDIDLAFNLFQGKKPVIMSAKGTKVFTKFNDIINATVRFGDSLAIFEISRISDAKERKLSAFGDNYFAEADMINQQCRFIKSGKEESFAGEKEDILFEELKSFVNAIDKSEEPLVSLEDGINSLSFAHKILQRIK